MVLGCTLALTGCMALAPEPPPVVGALGVTVDEAGRPVVLVEPCGGTVARVDLAGTREGLAPDQENTELGSFVARSADPGWTELALHEPAAPWEGEPVEVGPDARGVIASGTTVDGEILTQVAFRAGQLPGMEPGTVYLSDPAGEGLTLEEMTRSAFTALVCGRD